MDFAFTPEQDALREQAREFLAANPEPSWQELAELGWTGVSVAGGARRRRPRLPRGGDRVRGDGAGAHARAVLVDRGRDAAGAAAGAPGRGGPGRRAGRLRPARSSPTSTPPRSVAIVGGDSIWELEGAERELLQTNDVTRPLGVVSGGDAGSAARELGAPAAAPGALAGGARARGVRRRHGGRSSSPSAT